jgi:hypothetical protein
MASSLQSGACRHPRPMPNPYDYSPLRGMLPCVLKGLDRADEVAARDTGVALLNQLLRGFDLLRIYVRNDRLVDRDLRQLTRGISECRDNRRY